TVIPRSLYVGSIVNASYWVIPERGEMIAFATTYEGRSLEDMVASQVAKGFRLEAGAYNQAFAGLKAVHEAGVVHGDLILCNLVFDGEKITFIDFGNALLRSEYGSDMKSFEKDKEKDPRQLRSMLNSIRSRTPIAKAKEEEEAAAAESFKDEPASQPLSNNSTADKSDNESNKPDDRDNNSDADSDSDSS
ncbi:MAG: hypothetical protein SGBAC_013598, partial [Bacillariaceae sp.]